MHFDSRKNLSALNNERLAKIWNPGSVKPRTRNHKLHAQLLRFVFSQEKPNAKGLYQCFTSNNLKRENHNSGQNILKHLRKSYTKTYFAKWTSYSTS